MHICHLERRVLFRFANSFSFSRYDLSVIGSEGKLISCQTSEEAFNAFEQSGVDHIDLIAS